MHEVLLTIRFPQPTCESANVSDSLKSRSRILPVGTNSEIRINHYNLLLLMLWKAKIDVQFVGESSLALTHYVSGYVTKAMKSSMQEIWPKVSENKSIYGCLWSFLYRSLCSRECCLYKASNLLLGDQLTDKSTTVHWVDVSMPQKKSCRQKTTSCRNRRQSLGLAL